MNKTQLLKTIDTVENTFTSLRELVDDLYTQITKLEKDKEDNVLVRNDIINTQRKVLKQIKGFKEKEEKLDQKAKSVESETIELNEKRKKLDKDIEELNRKEDKINEKIKIASNIERQARELEDKEQSVKMEEAKLKSERDKFEEYKKTVDRKFKSNNDFKLKLDVRERNIISREERVSRILNDE